MSNNRLAQRGNWAELPQELLQRCLGGVTLQDRLQHSAPTCRAWNAAACAACSTVAASFVQQHPGSPWPCLSRAYHTQLWLRKHSQRVVTLQLHASNCDKPLNMNIPFGSMPNLKSLQLTSLHMPRSSWQALSSISSGRAAAAVAGTTRHGTSTSSSSRAASSSGITELVLSDSPDSLQEMALVKLQGLRRMQLTGWQGTAGQLGAALDSSSGTLTELALSSCNVSSCHLTASGPLSTEHHNHVAAAMGVRAPVAAGNVAACLVVSLAAMLASLPSLKSLELRSCKVFTPTMTDSPSTQAPQVPQLLGLQRLDIQFGFNYQQPAALLSMVSPSTLTRLELTAVSGGSRISSKDLLSRLSRLQQLQHCKLGYGCAHYAEPADALTVLCELSQLTYLCLEQGGLSVQQLVRHVYCRSDALPNLRVLEIMGRQHSATANHSTHVTAGSWCEVEPCNTKFLAKDGRSMQELLLTLAAADSVPFAGPLL